MVAIRTHSPQWSFSVPLLLMIHKVVEAPQAHSMPGKNMKELPLTYEETYNANCLKLYLKIQVIHDVDN
jgi:hypothetical protein